MSANVEHYSNGFAGFVMGLNHGAGLLEVIPVEFISKATLLPDARLAEND